ncbi:unnamed protein product [Lymnaea stagnalis]|uniref:Claudin n=1 Tax=Lymnaea stagnalis TaxID=6523 RepID=A0AAV2HFA0_LYMST
MAEPAMIKSVSALALLGLASGCGLTLASLVSSTWMTLEDGTRVGLFSTCIANHCDRINFTQGDTGAEKHFRFKVVRGLLVSGLITGVCGFITALGFVVDAVRSKGVSSLTLLRASMVLNPIAGCITIIGAVVFASTIYIRALQLSATKLDYSFGLAVAGGGTSIISAMLVYTGGPRKVTIAFRDAVSSRRAILLASVPQPPAYSSPLQHVVGPPPPYDLQKSLVPPAYDDAPLLPPPYYSIFDQRNLAPP